jgi:hypothetical protein
LYLEIRIGHPDRSGQDPFPVQFIEASDPFCPRGRPRSPALAGAVSQPDQELPGRAFQPGSGPGPGSFSTSTELAGHPPPAATHHPPGDAEQVEVDFCPVTEVVS